MQHDISRVIIETVVKNKLKDIKESPERSIRNLVDMALHFSGGRFQREFFEAAQRMLENENSAYYKMIRDAVFFTEEKRLMAFGMNLGYNSCTLGATTIRDIEQTEQFNVPWSIALEIETLSFGDREYAYHNMIEQGEQLGIYSWLLFAKDQPNTALSLAAEHPDHAFAIFCGADSITHQLLDEANGIFNIMFVVRCDEGADSACQLLRNLGFLYSIYVPYSEEYAEEIKSGAVFYTAEQLHPSFTMLIADPSCSTELQQNIYRCVVDARNAQEYQTIPWDVIYDGCQIDSIISDETCAAWFDRTGTLYTLPEKAKLAQYNIFDQPLREILKAAFPKG